MRQRSGTGRPPAEKVVKDIRRRTRKQHSAEDKIRVVLQGLRGEESIANSEAGQNGNTTFRLITFNSV